MTSLPHRAYWQQQGKSVSSDTEDESGLLVGFNDVGNRKSLQGDQFLTGFDDMMTFEYKTICIISRYPFWSAFRRFLSHLHILSGSSSDVPLERYISHLMLTVPVPKPGGQCILVPLPAVASPMVIGLPPLKDFPVLDLSFRRLFSCLDVPTVVTIVLGFLALERKVSMLSIELHLRLLLSLTCCIQHVFRSLLCQRTRLWFQIHANS
jgi:DENN (AEX-3) domain.